eukprot:6630779-Prymnesium_polylepis.2
MLSVNAVNFGQQSHSAIAHIRKEAELILARLQRKMCEVLGQAEPRCLTEHSPRRSKARLIRGTCDQLHLARNVTCYHVDGVSLRIDQNQLAPCVRCNAGDALDGVVGLDAWMPFDVLLRQECVCYAARLRQSVSSDGTTSMPAHEVRVSIATQEDI